MSIYLSDYEHFSVLFSLMLYIFTKHVLVKSFKKPSRTRTLPVVYSIKHADETFLRKNIRPSRPDRAVFESSFKQL